MKIASLLSVSAVFAFTSLVAAVGCSAPTPDASKDKSASAAQSGDDGKDNKDAPATTTKPGTTTTTKPGTTTTTKPGTTTTPAPGDKGAACLTCVGATSKAGLSMKCQSACKDGDDACFEKCATDNCGADGKACDADFGKCETQCSGPAPTPEQEQKFMTCIAAKNPKAKAFIDCDEKCTNAACSDKCFNDAKCDDQCDTDLEACEKEAG